MYQAMLLPTVLWTLEKQLRLQELSEELSIQSEEDMRFITTALTCSCSGGSGKNYENLECYGDAVLQVFFIFECASLCFCHLCSFMILALRLCAAVHVQIKMSGGSMLAIMAV